MKIHTFACGPFQTNTYLVEDEQTRSALLIDPTMDSGRVYDAILARRLSVALIVNTHGHIDHVYCDAYFSDKTGAVVAIHQADVPVLAASGKMAAMFGLKAPAPVVAGRVLAEGDSVAAGSLSFQVIHTPGHTPGGVCLYGHGALFAGDTLFAGSIGRTDLPGGDHKMLITAITGKLLTLPGETIIYSGHGLPSTIAEEGAHNPFLRR